MKPEPDKDLVDAIWLIATNDGDAHRKRDPRLAVFAAFDAYQRIQRENECEDFNLCKSELIKALAKRWSSE